MIRNVRRLGAAPVLAAPEGSIPLYSYSLDPNVQSNPNPIYAPGSPQWLAAVASGANPNQPAYTPEQIAQINAGIEPPPPGSTLAPGTWNGDCSNPVVADAAGNLAYVQACYPNTPLGAYLASQPPSSAVMTTGGQAPAPATAPAAALNALAGLPWYYYAGGAAALYFLFSK